MTFDTAWDAYVAAEQAAFEAAGSKLWLSYNREQLLAIKEQAEEAGSDIADVVSMMLGEKEIPAGWRVPVLAVL